MFVIGPDISHFQKPIDWVTVKNIPFVIMKATQGTDFVDPSLDHNYNSTKNGGQVKGFYHFISGSESGKKQADFFIKTVKKLGGWDNNSLPPILDFEASKYGSPTKQQAIDFVARIKEKLNNTPVILYAGSYLRSIGGGRLGADYLWIPRYGPNKFTPEILPNGWEMQDVFGWQYTNGDTNGTNMPSGVGGQRMDMTVLMLGDGSLTSLYNLIGVTRGGLLGDAGVVIAGGALMCGLYILLDKLYK